MIVGEKVRDLLLKNGKNAEFLANELGVVVGTIYGMYKKDGIDSKHLQKIAELFNVPITYFFEDVEVESGRVSVSGDSNLTVANSPISGGLKNMPSPKKNAEQANDCNTLKELLREKERVIEAKNQLLDEKERVIQAYMQLIKKGE